MAPNLSPIADELWLRPDPERARWLAPKRALMQQRRTDVFAVEPGSERACAEVRQMITSHLGYTAPIDMPTDLEQAAALVSDDLCVMQQDARNQWCLKAASLCAPTYWHLSEKIGLPLTGLHSPVPGGDPELAARVSRIFSAMRAGQIFQRFNWTVQSGDDAFTPDARPLKAVASTIQPEDALQALHLRVERQTIRKLPETGAVLFTIRICLDPLKAVFEVPGAKDAFANAWRGAHQDVAAYKGWAVYEPLVEHILR